MSQDPMDMHVVLVFPRCSKSEDRGPKVRYVKSRPPRYMYPEQITRDDDSGVPCFLAWRLAA